MPGQTRKASKPRPKKTTTTAVAPSAASAPDRTYGSGWRTGAETGIQPVQLPSGATCLARNSGLQGLIEAGVLEKLDPLTSLVDKELVQPAKRGGVKLKSLGNLTNEDITAMTEIADRVTATLVVEPHVELAPMPRCQVCAWEGLSTGSHKPQDGHDFVPTPRDPNVFYTDGIDLEDKLAILQFAMEGTKALESFRDKRQQALDAVESG